MKILVGEADNVANELTRQPLPENLFAAGKRRFVRRQLHLQLPCILGEFVSGIQKWHVGRRAEVRTDSETVEWRSEIEKPFDLELVQISTGENLYPFQMGTVQQLPCLPRQSYKVSESRRTPDTRKSVPNSEASSMRR